jgi:serine/threonine protein kinase
VLHRDVKPANILLDGAGRVMVADFGLAKLLDADTLTAAGDVVGTVQYMAPEQLRGQADERSDVYGLGVTLYELATGRPAFDPAHPAALVRAIGEGNPARPRDWNPAIPADLEAVIRKAMARDPADRYPSAEDLADDLDAVRHAIPLRTTVPRPARRVPWRAAAVVGLLAFAGWGWAAYLRERAAAVRQREEWGETLTAIEAAGGGPAVAEAFRRLGRDRP